MFIINKGVSEYYFSQFSEFFGLRLLSYAQLQKQLKWNHITYSIPTKISLLNEEEVEEEEELATCSFPESTEAFCEVHFYKLLKLI